MRRHAVVPSEDWLSWPALGAARAGVAALMDRMIVAAIVAVIFFVFFIPGIPLY